MATNLTVSTASPATSVRTGESIAQRLRLMVERWKESSRLRSELMQMSSREMADLGFSASDIPDIVNGTFRRP